MATKITKRQKDGRVTILNSDLTLTELAERTKISKSHLSRIVRRLAGPSPDNLKALARALNCSQEELRSRLKITESRFD